MYIQKCTSINVNEMPKKTNSEIHEFSLRISERFKACLYQESLLSIVYCMHLQVGVVWLH